MKKTKLSARLLASMLAVVFCAWGGVTSCSDGSDVSVPGQENVSGGGEQGSGPSSKTEMRSRSPRRELSPTPR